MFFLLVIYLLNHLCLVLDVEPGRLLLGQKSVLALQFIRRPSMVNKIGYKDPLSVLFCILVDWTDFVRAVVVHNCVRFGGWRYQGIFGVRNRPRAQLCPVEVSIEVQRLFKARQLLRWIRATSLDYLVKGLAMFDEVCKLWLFREVIATEWTQFTLTKRLNVRLSREIWLLAGRLLHSDHLSLLFLRLQRASYLSSAAKCLHVPRL